MAFALGRLGSLMDGRSVRRPIEPIYNLAVFYTLDQLYTTYHGELATVSN